MCLIALAWKQHPDYPLVLVANRDEFHARPTAPLAFWGETPALCAGRDLREGGTWLGLHRSGRLAAVTNVRDDTMLQTRPRTRGALTTEFLLAQSSADDYAQHCSAHANEYGGYNLLLWDGQDMVYASNRPGARWSRLPPGLHGLSNAQLDTPWPKVCHARTAMRDWLAAGTQDWNALLAAMADEREAADAELPDTGIGLERERLLSPPFIRTPEYGTRCTTVVRIDRQGQAEMFERRFNSDGGVSGEQVERFTLNLKP